MTKMRFHIRKNRIIIMIVIVFCILSSVVVSAQEQTARLKAGLQEDYLYYSVTIDELNNVLKNDKNNFKTKYGDKYIVMGACVENDSIVSNGKKLIAYQLKTNEKVSINTQNKEVQGVVNSLKPGDKINVYGKVNITGILGDGYEVIAQSIVKQSESIINHSYNFVSGNSYLGEKVSDITPEKKVIYYLPDSWQGLYVETALNNNDVKGHQYCLNAISPQQTDYPENFYIFYFINETYIKNPPKNPSDSNIEDIEKLIIKNILTSLDDDFNIKITDIETPNGIKLDYYSTTYRPKDGNDYRLEFLFRPDNEGITCMLYLYFPKNGAANHVDDVVYLIETMEVK